MELPEIGLGTWDLRGKECTHVVEMALELGYRHIDTAHSYDNHEAIHKAIKGVDRSQLYLTSKIALENQVDPAHPETSVRRALELALKELGTDYLDLYLIHWPQPDFPLEAVFAAMQTLKEQGKIREAGVSNYTIHHLEDLRKAGWQPFANQVEFHPYLYQKDLLEYCQTQDIQLISFRSFGKGKLLQDEPLFAQIGKAHHKTAAQVILRWLLQKQIPAVPKSTSKKHLQQNLDILDFSLTEAEVFALDHLDKGKRYCKGDSSIYTY